MGMPYLQVKAMGTFIGNFLKRSSDSKGHYFKADSKTSYFYLESIVYPFAQFTKKKNEFFVENSEYFKLFTSLSIQEWHSCLLFNFTYTISHFTVFVDIYF